ncbi:substrate-binding domain-containing protein [bacterium]|nr:substrate-binding domain-containing protein [bacterium]
MERRQFLFGLAALSCACARSDSSVVALVASSLQPWLETRAALFQLSCSYGGSRNLVLQAERGAPASLLLLAYRAEVKNFSGPRPFASNRLVLVARRGEPKLKNGSTVAVGDPKLAPVGRFGLEAMERLGVQPAWVFTRDDRSALTLLETGHVDLAVVYASDLRGRNLGNPQVLECSAIDYYFLQRAGDSKGNAFALWLNSAECKQSLQEFGLVVRDA